MFNRIERSITWDEVETQVIAQVPTYRGNIFAYAPRQIQRRPDA